MSDSQSQTKPSTPQNTLDSYVSSSKSPITPQIVATSAEIRDRGSAFVANIFTATSQAEAKAHAQYVKNILHGHKKASHEIAAWRCMIVKRGFTGLGGPEEFELAQGHLDDGEKWAGDRVLKVMQSLAVIDAVVVVSRW
jgi:putative IMPACT (imprinted ancient) family translation regulator